MLILTVQFCALSLVIVFAGVWLARSTSRLAEATKLGQSFAGLVLLAGATSLPELSVGWSAVRLGADDLALGGLIGSSLLNLLILSVLDLVTRTRGRMLSRIAAAHAISAIASMLLTGIILLFLLLKTGWVWWGMGPGSATVLLAYLFSMRLIYFDQATVQDAEGSTPRRDRWPLAAAAYVAAAAVIFVVAPLVTRTAEELATMTGLGDTFFGTTFLAAVTSMPEAVTTLAAIRMGTVDMAVGNVFGSNAFNMVLVGVIDAASPTPLLSVAAPTHAITATAAILVTCVTTVGLLYRAEKRWWIVEPDALLVALLVLGALLLVYLQ